MGGLWTAAYGQLFHIAVLFLFTKLSTCTNKTSVLIFNKSLILCNIFVKSGYICQSTNLGLALPMQTCYYCKPK